jgi:choline dehydrogenase-like flavoprotein
MIRSSNPDDLPLIKPNWLTNENDQRKAVKVVRVMRELIAQPALRAYVGKELTPGPEVQTDEQILNTYLRVGSTGNHAVATCRMGSGPDAVLDNHLRVRGLDNLRVVDCSSIPLQMSANTNAPVMVLAWRAADIINAEGR